MQVGTAEAGGGILNRIAEGPWAGWSQWVNDPFEAVAGPFFCRRDEGGGIVCAFRTEARHMNASGALHGGCLMTFADFAIFMIAQKDLEGAGSVTASFTGDFLSGVGPGALVECRGEVVKAGRSLVFVRGMITSQAEAIMSFQALIKKTKGPGVSA